jgi:hypothetical protein
MLHLPGQQGRWRVQGRYGIGADLAGAAFGSLITGLFIIPLTGVVPASFLFAVLSLVIAAKIHFKIR